MTEPIDSRMLAHCESTIGA